MYTQMLVLYIRIWRDQVNATASRFPPLSKHWSTDKCRNDVENMGWRTFSMLACCNSSNGVAWRTMGITLQKVFNKRLNAEWISGRKVVADHFFLLLFPFFYIIQLYLFSFHCSLHGVKSKISVFLFVQKLPFFSSLFRFFMCWGWDGS